MSDLRVSETHISRLVFTTDRVYKVKKAVVFDFADLSSLDARRAACDAEVRLNRRLAPDVYEGVGTFRAPDGTEEPVVVMRRLPDQCRLSYLVQRDAEGVRDRLEKLAGLLARFHDRAQRGPPVSAACAPHAIARLWEDNLSALSTIGRGVVPEPAISELARLALRYVGGRTDLFAARVEAGRAVDGHGDLLADDIFCLSDGDRILDCLDFDDRLRYVDALSDAASLAMDLERLGRPDLATAFLDAYKVASGDDWPDSLAHMYVAYRATVRAKVACINAREGRLTAAQARQLVDMALNHLRAGAVRLVLVGGLPGTGKSTVARHLSARTGWVLLQSDVVRKLLAGLDPGECAASAFGTGIYSPDWTALVYGELLDAAEQLMSMGESVIIDATWNHRAWRDGAAAAAARGHADLLRLRCESSPVLARDRLTSRRNDRSSSDASPAIADALALAVEPWEDATVVDTSGPVRDALVAAFRTLGLAD